MCSSNRDSSEGGKAYLGSGIAKEKGYSMKTLKREQEIVRVQETQVEAYLQNGWEFCSKSEWKEKRDSKSGSLVAKAASR